MVVGGRMTSVNSISRGSLVGGSIHRDGNIAVMNRLSGLPYNNRIENARRSVTTAMPITAARVQPYDISAHNGISAMNGARGAMDRKQPLMSAPKSSAMFATVVPAGSGGPSSSASVASANDSVHDDMHSIDDHSIDMDSNSLDGSGMDDDGTGNKRDRKPYTMTKPRELWSNHEHQLFLESLKLYERDWKKIADHIGTKSVIQIRSHAQKYFIKMQKLGLSTHVPPIVNHVHIVHLKLY